MKRIIQKIWLVMALLCASIYASAYDFEVDGLCYNIVSISDNTCEVTYGLNYGSTVTIPSKVIWNGREFKNIRIGAKAFADCTKLESVIIEEGITSIGGSAFKNCSNLKTLTIPASIVELWSYAFVECTSLEELIFADSNKPIKISDNGTHETTSLPDNIKVYATHRENGKTYYRYTETLFQQSPLKKVYLGRNISFNSHHQEKGGDYTTSPFSSHHYESFVIGEKVTELSWLTFYKCQIDEVELRNGAEDLKILAPDKKYGQTITDRAIFTADHKIKKVILDRGYNRPR